MGLRGVGANRQIAAKQKPAKLRKLPWLDSSLDRPGRVIAFLEFLPVTKGILAGKPVALLPGQVQFIQDVYGPEREDGRRLVTMAIKSEPKGNGKTGLVAGLALCHLLGPEAEQRGEVYSAAINRLQAGIMFNEMEAIILRVPELADRVNIQRFSKKIEVIKKGQGEGSVYEALSADAKRAHGLAPSLWVYDELAQASDRTLLDNLTEGMGKRREALGIVISTQAPDDDHVLSQLIDDGLTGADPSTVVHLTSAPVDADPFDIETVKTCNPAFGSFLDLDDLKKSMERARRIPAFEPAYRNLRLNQRVDARTENRLATATVWRLGATPVNLDRLKGRRCYGGLDLSGKHDLTALVLVFPDDEPEPSYDIVPFFWTPEGALAARAQGERERFQQWIAAKHLIPIPGPVIRFRTIAEKLAGLRRDYGFDVQAVGYDRWRIDELKLEIEDIGGDVALEEFGQGWKDMAPAIEFFTECALTGRLHHSGHPVLSACVANAILVPDAAGNMKIDKGKSNSRGTTRVDGAVALCMALGTARKRAEAPAPQYQVMFV
jgi:phage terminase large subunit-like protein